MHGQCRVCEALREMNSNLWRLFIPTWRLFDRPGPRLELLVETDQGWCPFLAPPTPWHALIFNPRGNLHHARMNLLERFVEEAQAHVEPETLVSFQLIKHMVGGRPFRVEIQ